MSLPKRSESAKMARSPVIGREASYRSLVSIVDSAGTPRLLRALSESLMTISASPSVTPKKEPSRRPYIISGQKEDCMVVRVVLLGASGVGKTALLHQFIYGHFTPPNTRKKPKDLAHKPTAAPITYYTSAFLNERLFELQLVDLPAIEVLPRDSFEEWNFYRGYGLTRAEAFLLLYDSSRDETFETVENLYSQLVDEFCTNAPIIVVALKSDLMSLSLSPRKTLANRVRKQWRVPFVECSAKHNLRVNLVFQELVTAIDTGITPEHGSKNKNRPKSKTSGGGSSKKMPRHLSTRSRVQRASSTTDVDESDRRCVIQ